MKGLYLIRYGEIGLKGENRPFFEKKLINNIKKVLRDRFLQVFKTHGRIFIEAKGDEDEILKDLSRVFGIVSISPVIETGLTLQELQEAGLKAIRDYGTYEGKTFKVETRRPNKSFPYTSPEISRLVGAHILKNIQNLTVNINNPDILVNVEVREKGYVYCKMVDGPRGLPIGVSGKAFLMLSGGIDSPVAGWMVMKRGVEIECVYFHSFPFTSDRAREKVRDLCKILASYSNEIILHTVHFTDVLKELQEKTPEDYLTILMRRMMVRITEKIAQRRKGLGIITGESIGQVASQTLHSLNSTNSVANLPIFRPLIGFDKEEIVQKAIRIGTYDISIRPYEDCCTVFVPRHPKTRPSIEQVEAVESVLDVDKLTITALKNIETEKVINN